MLIFVAAVVATAFAFSLLAAPVTHAADAVWDGDAITYADNKYQKIPDAKDGDGLNLPAGSHVYAYITPKDDSSSTSTQKAYIIYFAPSEDPTKSKSAKYAAYDFTPPATYKNPTDQKTISLEGKAGDKSGTSCSIPSIGWIICPVSNFLATSMDWIYSNVLTQFLAVRPVETTTSSSLFKAWAIMRSFANVAFVIAFLVIIWSQVSSIGISNYGIKKMLPRLVIAAVLVNVSYWICAIAIDVSNILGYSLNDLFMSITKTVQGSGSNTGDVTNWQSVTTALLSGGTIVAAGLTALVAIGSVSGAIALLLPVLLGVLVAALVAVVIMAARQAIIVILVIVAPLAFVAYLLPNTEKYFEKWKDLFITMLMLFPIFSVIFGGSQLAGTAIIQNADSIIMLILGMAVQVAPLVIMPFLIKFSGSLLSRIGGMANDRSKGLIDRSKGFANDYAGAKKAKNLARSNTRWRPLASAVQGIDTGRRKREDQQKVDEAVADNRWHGSKAHERIDRAGREAERTKQIIEQHHNAEWDQHARTNADSRAQELKLRVGTDQASLAKTQLEDMYEGYKSADPNDESLSALQRSAVITSQDMALTAMRQEMAKRKQASQLSDTMLKDKTREIEGQKILEYAGGVMEATGAESAISKAITAERKEFGQNVENNIQLMRHFKMSSDQRQDLALGTNVPVEKDGVSFIFQAANDHAREAAIEEQLKTGSYGQIETIIKESGVTRDPVTNEVTVAGKTSAYSGTIARAVLANGLQSKASFLGSKTIDQIEQGLIYGESGINQAVVYNLQEGKVKEEVFAGMDAGAIKRMFEVGLNPKYADQIKDPVKRRAYQENVVALRESAHHIINNDLLNRHATKSALDVFKEYQLPPRNP